MSPELCNPQAELALLAAVLRADAAERVQMATKLREEWFSAAERTIVWRVMADLIGRNLPVDTTLLSDSLRSEKIEPKVVEALTAHLSQLVPSANYWRPLAERVQGYYTKRRMFEISLQMMELSKDLTRQPGEVLEEAESQLFALHQEKESRGMQHISKFLKPAYNGIEEAIKNRGYVTGGIPTGFTDLDRAYIKGMRPGHLILAAAPPGGGKTVFMMKLAWNVATGHYDYQEGQRAREQGRGNYQPKNVGIFTLEMDEIQLSERLLVKDAQVELGKAQGGMMSRKEVQDMMKAIETLKGSQLFFEHCPGASIQELRVKARYNVQRYKLDMICIDYAQLITSSTKAAQANRTQEMMDVSKGLKLLGQECGVPVLVLAQPKQETWGQRAPLSALGETSQLAKDADLVLMLGFWEIIARNMKLDEVQEDMGETVHAYIDVVKNRHGANTSGKMPIKLRWDRDFFDFKSTNNRLLDASGKNQQV